jgi:hypothetical protein
MTDKRSLQCMPHASGPEPHVQCSCALQSCLHQCSLSSLQAWDLPPCLTMDPPLYLGGTSVTDWKIWIVGC